MNVIPMRRSASGVRRKPAKTGLLEKLQEWLGCEYLSDIHYVNPRLLCTYFRAAEAREYALNEWNDAVWYITGKHVLFQSCEAARENIIEWVSR